MKYSEIEFPLDNHQLVALQIESQRQQIQIPALVLHIVDAYLKSMTGRSEKDDTDSSA